MPTKARDRILGAATSLFLQDGIQAVGINRIIAEADVAPMTLYRQFGSKDKLVAAALKRWSDQWLHLLTTRLDYCTDPEARFAGLWDALEEWLASEQFRGSLMVNAATELRGKPYHPAHEAITAHQLAMRQLLEDLAKFVGAADPPGLAAQLHLIVDGAVVAAVVARPPMDPASVRTVAKAALDAASEKGTARVAHIQPLAARLLKRAGLATHSLAVYGLRRPAKTQVAWRNPSIADKTPMAGGRHDG